MICAGRERSRNSGADNSRLRVRSVFSSSSKLVASPTGAPGANAVASSSNRIAAGLVPGAYASFSYSGRTIGAVSVIGRPGRASPPSCQRF